MTSLACMIFSAAMCVVSLGAKVNASENRMPEKMRATPSSAKNERAIQKKNKKSETHSKLSIDQAQAIVRPILGAIYPALNRDTLH